jgi:hypothetical protein
MVYTNPHIQGISLFQDVRLWYFLKKDRQSASEGTEEAGSGKQE